MHKKLCALALGAALIGAPVTPATAGNTYAAVCGQQTWTGKDPSKCKSNYTVYKTNGSSRPKVIFRTNNKYPVDWKAISRGYRAAENWCKDSPIACGVVLAVGVQVVSGWLGPAHS